MVSIVLLIVVDDQNFLFDLPPTGILVLDFKEKTPKGLVNLMEKVLKEISPQLEKGVDSDVLFKN